LISKLLLSILLIAVITVFINSTPNAFAQTTIDFSSGAYSSVAPGPLVNTYTESGYTFQTPLVFRQHFDSNIGTGALAWHESGANTVDNVILSGFGGSTFNLLSFDVVSSSSTLTLTGSNGQTFVVPSGDTGTFTPGILGVTSVTWDLAGSAFRDSVDIDNILFESSGGEGIPTAFKQVEEAGHDKGVLQGGADYVKDCTRSNLIGEDGTGTCNLRYEGCTEGFVISLGYSAIGITSNEGLSKFTLKSDRMFSTRDPTNFDVGVKVFWFEGLLEGEGVRFQPLINCLVLITP